MSFGAFLIFPIFSNLVSQKRLVVEQNGPKYLGFEGTRLLYRYIEYVCPLNAQDQNQYGFRKIKHSTNQPIIEFVSKVIYIFSGPVQGF